MQTNNLLIAQRIKEAREYLGLTQHQVAKALSMPRSAVSDIETGKRKVTADELKRIANLFRHPVNHFLGEEPALDPDIAALARTAKNLSDNDRRELLRFAMFLEYQSKDNPSGGDV